MNCTDSFINRICSITRENVTPEAYRAAEECLLDWLGVAFAGAGEQYEKNVVFAETFSSVGETAVPGMKDLFPQSTAAVLNGMNSHYLELDDGHKGGMIHLGTVVISALMAMAYSEKLTGRDFLFGIVTGYEAAVNIAEKMQPGHKKKGYHATGTCGAIGATVGICMACGFTPDKVKNAVSAAVTGAGGLLEIQEDSSEMKPYNSGQAALTAVSAVAMAKAGYAGPDDILGGKRGLYAVLGDNADIGGLTFNIRKDEPFVVERIYRKLYASCRHGHSAVEAAITLKNEGVDYRNIEAVDLYTYEMAIRGHDHKIIPNSNAAKMSIPFDVATGFVIGQLSPWDLQGDALDNRDVIRTMNLVKIHEDAEMSRDSMTRRAARLEVRLSDGEIVSRQVDYAKGDYENPLTHEELEKKFITLMEKSGYNEKYCSEIIEAVGNIEEDFDRLLELLKK